MTTAETDAARRPDLAGRPRRSPLLVLAAWTLLLVAGYALVFTLGQPLPTLADERAAAYAPATPVDEATALRSADTIVRLEYPDFAQAPRTVQRKEEFGDDRFVIVYSRPERQAAVRISISVESGRVRVSSFP